jgi:hypothetical protein
MTTKGDMLFRASGPAFSTAWLGEDRVMSFGGGQGKAKTGIFNGFVSYKVRGRWRGWDGEMSDALTGQKADAHPSDRFDCVGPSATVT